MSELVMALEAIDHMSVEDCFLQSPLFAKAAAEITRLTGAATALTALEATHVVLTKAEHEAALLTERERCVECAKPRVWPSSFSLHDVQRVIQSAILKGEA